MTSLIIIVLGTFWEASMDVIGTEHNYRQSIWNQFANYMDKKGYPFYGQQFWNKNVAWRNKWKNGDPDQGEAFFLSSRMLSTLCDGWHTMKYFWLLHFFAAIVLYEPMTGYPFLDFCIYYFAFGNAHSFFFKIMQKRD
jgi:hypothetical protein